MRRTGPLTIAVLACLLAACGDWHNAKLPGDAWTLPGTSPEIKRMSDEERAAFFTFRNNATRLNRTAQGGRSNR